MVSSSRLPLKAGNQIEGIVETSNSTVQAAPEPRRLPRMLGFWSMFT